MADDNDIETEWFAFGQNEIDGVGCPVVTATGNGPGAMLQEVVDHYDTNCGQEQGVDEGIVQKDTAQRAWEQAIDELRRYADEYVEEPGVEAQYRVMIQHAEEVKEEVF